MRALCAFALVLAVSSSGCGSVDMSGERRDTDGDGAADAFDAHPTSAFSADRRIAQQVLAHKNQPGLVTAASVQAAMRECGVGPAKGVALVSRQQIEDQTPEDPCQP